MIRLKDRWCFKPQPGAVSALVFHHTLIVLLLTRHCGGESQIISPPQPIVAAAGDDVVLPCRLEPAADASVMTVEWTKPEPTRMFVHVWRDGVELENKKHGSYEGRTSVSTGKLKLGDVSLTLSRVRLSDEGTYRCFVPTLNREATVELVVGAVSSPLITLVKTENDKESSGVELQCESEGWYPEPEVLWLDAEGNLLSAGPTETVRGPDDLYTVSSRVTVEKRHSNSFTCRVQQKDINQTRETHTHVFAPFVSFPCGSAAHVVISLAVVTVVAVGVGFVVWKWRRKHKSNRFKTATTTGSNDTELHSLIVEKGETPQVTVESLNVKDLEKTEEKLTRDLKELEEERSDVSGLIKFLTAHKMDMQNQIHKFGLELAEVIESAENENQLLTNTKQTEENHVKSTAENLNETKPNLYMARRDIEKKMQETDTVLKVVFRGVSVATEKKKALDELREEMTKKLEKIRKQRDQKLQSEPSQT